MYRECMLDRRIDLLRILDQVGTITEAAHLLHRSPSGYSRQLRGLADELGVELLEQHGREVRLTPAGKCVVAYAYETHAAWEVTKSALIEETGAIGTLTIGAHPTALSALVGPSLEELAKLHPHVTVHMVESEAPHCFHQLVTGQLDACIVPARADVPPAGDQRFHQSALGAEPMDALVPSAHPVAEQDRVELQELSECLWILPGHDRSGHYEILSACHLAGFTPEAIHHAQDTQAVADLVEATGTVSLTSRFATYQSAAVRVPLGDEPALHRQLLLCTLTGSETGEPIQTLSKLVSARLDNSREKHKERSNCQ